MRQRVMLSKLVNIAAEDSQQSVGYLLQPEVILTLLIATLGGTAVGLERQWSGHADGPSARFGGIRTFTMLGAVSGLSGWLLTLGQQASRHRAARRRNGHHRRRLRGRKPPGRRCHNRSRRAGRRRRGRLRWSRIVSTRQRHHRPPHVCCSSKSPDCTRWSRASTTCRSGRRCGSA